jgi:hypothetical protein
MLYIGRRAAIALLADSFAGSCGLRSACGQRQHFPPARGAAEPTQLFIKLATAHSSANSALFLQFEGRVGGMEGRLLKDGGVRVMRKNGKKEKGEDWDTAGEGGKVSADCPLAKVSRKGAKTQRDEDSAGFTPSCLCVRHWRAAA